MNFVEHTSKNEVSKLSIIFDFATEKKFSNVCNFINGKMEN